MWPKARSTCPDFARRIERSIDPTGCLANDVSQHSGICEGGWPKEIPRDLREALRHCRLAAATTMFGPATEFHFRFEGTR